MALSFHLRSPFRTFTFIVSCMGTVVATLAAYVAQAFHLRGYPIFFLGNACLCAIGAATHWYLDRLLTPRFTDSKKGP